MGDVLKRLLKSCESKSLALDRRRHYERTHSIRERSKEARSPRSPTQLEPSLEPPWSSITISGNMRLFARQKLLLSLTDAFGGDVAATDLQKTLFLYTRKRQKEPSYRFVPYKYGCFSFQSYADRKSLETKGLLEPLESGGWRLTAEARPHVEQDTVRRLRSFLANEAPERGDALIARVYREYPYSASRSEVPERVIPNLAERRQIREAAPKRHTSSIVTIGYEGDCIDGYLNRLLRHDIRLLCDVRRNPLSRKTGFSRNQLADYCQHVGIEYRHLPALGIPGHRRRDLKTQADYDALVEEYESEDLPKAKDAVEDLTELWERYSRIALTCFEKKTEKCHRHCVAEAMERARSNIPPAIHI